MPRSVLTLMSNQRSFEHIHPMRARMLVERVDDAGGVADQAYLHAGIRIFDQVLTKQRAPDLLVGALLPLNGIGVEGGDFEIRHVLIMSCGHATSRSRTRRCAHRPRCP